MEEIRCINCMEKIEPGTLVCPLCGYEQKDDGKHPYAMKPGTILHGKYLVGHVLGQGGFGITYVGFDLTLEMKVAVKEYFPMGMASRSADDTCHLSWNETLYEKDQINKGVDSFLKEARRMAKLDSLPGIVRVKDTFPDNETAYIIMDFVEGETLKQRLIENGTMSYEDCVELLSPLMDSLDQMHKKGLVHRDISPDNIMIRPDGTCCLLDLGAAKDLSNGRSQSTQMVMKKGFSPVEQCGSGGNIGSWTDVYAMSATIYYCLTGKLIPNSLDRILDDQPLPFVTGSGKRLIPKIQEVLDAGLAVRQKERIQTMSGLKERLCAAICSEDAQEGGEAAEEIQPSAAEDMGETQPVAPKDNTTAYLREDADPEEGPASAGIGEEPPQKTSGGKKRILPLVIIAAVVVVIVIVLIAV